MWAARAICGYSGRMAAMRCPAVTPWDRLSRLEADAGAAGETATRGAAGPVLMPKGSAAFFAPRSRTGKLGRSTAAPEGCRMRLEDSPRLCARRRRDSVSCCEICRVRAEMDWRSRRDRGPRRSERRRQQVRDREDLRVKQRQSEDERGSAELRRDRNHRGPAIIRAEQGSGFDE